MTLNLELDLNRDLIQGSMLSIFYIYAAFMCYGKESCENLAKWNVEKLTGIHCKQVQWHQKINVTLSGNRADIEIMNVIVITISH